MLKIALADDQALVRHGLKALRQRGNSVPVILLTTFDDPEALKEGISAGASGYLLKDAQPEALKQALQSAVRGERVFQPGPTIPVSTRAGELHEVGLTAQEAAILRLVAGGYSNKEIARHLGIAMGTVKNHISDILRKLDARDRTHAVLKALAGHLLS